MNSDLLVRLKEKLDEQTYSFHEGEPWGLYANVTNTFDLGMLSDKQIEVINASKLLSEYVWGEEFSDDLVTLNIFKNDGEILLNLEFSLGMYKEQSIHLRTLALGEAYELLKRNPGVWKEYGSGSNFY